MKLYQYFGHSTDRCDEDGKMIISEVPKGSMYINKTGCGLINYMNGYKFAELFINPELKQATKNPEENTQIMADFCESEIVIHKEGDDFVEAMYYPFGIFPSRGGDFLLFLSGFRDSEYFSNMKMGTHGLNYKKYSSGQLVPKKVIQELFAGALYPTQAMVSKTFTKAEYSFEELQTLGKELKIPISNLLQKYPGIHYNFLCRAVSNHCMEDALQRRIASAKKYRTQLNTLIRTILYEEQERNIKRFMDKMKSDPTFLEGVNILEIMYHRDQAPQDRKKYFTEVVKMKREMVKGNGQGKVLFPLPKRCKEGQILNIRTKVCIEPTPPKAVIMKARCPKGTTRNKTTKLCKGEKLPRCPKGTARNKTTKLCVKT